MHRVIGSNLIQHEAMVVEEMWADHTLYPKGLNMIPGGYAGQRYLSRIGHQNVDLEGRERAISDWVQTAERLGKPTPLIALKWMDDDYAAKVICGRDDRLNPQQVIDVRMMAKSGLLPADIARRVGARNVQQIERVLKGETYNRIH